MGVESHEVRILKDRIPLALGLSLILHLAAVFGAGFALSEKTPPKEASPYMVDLVSMPAPTGTGDKTNQMHEGKHEPSAPPLAPKKTVIKLREKPTPEPVLQAAAPPEIALEKETPPPPVNSGDPATTPPGPWEEGSGHAAEGAHSADGNGSSQGSTTGKTAGDGPVDSAFGTKDGPRFISKFSPHYPRIARDTGKEGTVVLRLTIDAQGNLTDVEVVEPAGSGFDEAAVRAVKNSRFSPAKKNGEGTVCKALLPVRFMLENDQGG